MCILRFYIVRTFKVKGKSKKKKEEEGVEIERYYLTIPPMQKARRRVQTTYTHYTYRSYR